MDLPEIDTNPDFRHASWKTAVGTGIAYGVVLAVIFALLFVVPYLLFRLLG